MLKLPSLYNQTKAGEAMKCALMYTRSANVFTPTSIDVRQFVALDQIHESFTNVRRTVGERASKARRSANKGFVRFGEHGGD